MAADWFKVGRNHKNAEYSKQASKRFFFEKKNQKTFVSLGAR